MCFPCGLFPHAGAERANSRGLWDSPLIMSGFVRLQRPYIFVTRRMLSNGITFVWRWLGESSLEIWHTQTGDYYILYRCLCFLRGYHFTDHAAESFHAQGVCFHAAVLWLNADILTWKQAWYSFSGRLQELNNLNARAEATWTRELKQPERASLSTNFEPTFYRTLRSQNWSYTCSHRGGNGFSPCQKGFCSLTQLLSWQKVSKFIVKTGLVLTLYKNSSCEIILWKLRPLVKKGVVWLNRNLFCKGRTHFHHDASTTGFVTAEL